MHYCREIFQIFVTFSAWFYTVQTSYRSKMISKIFLYNSAFSAQLPCLARHSLNEICKLLVINLKIKKRLFPSFLLGHNWLPPICAGEIWKICHDSREIWHIVVSNNTRAWRGGQLLNREGHSLKRLVILVRSDFLAQLYCFRLGE